MRVQPTYVSPFKEESLLDMLVDKMGIVSVFLLLAWFVVGVVHWICLGYAPDFAAYAFTNWMTSPWLTWPTFLWLGVNLFLWGIQMLNKGEDGSGILAMAGGALMIVGKWFLPAMLNNFFHALLYALGVGAS
jgi:hypothetical protein